MRYLWIALLLVACGSRDAVTEYTAMEINDSVAEETIVATMIDPYRDSLELSMNTVLVENATDLTRGIPESTLGNLIADLLLERALIEMLDSIRPLICLINIGGLRIDLPEGPITVGKVFELMPFENELDVVKLSPEQVNEMLNYLQKVGGQPVSGIEVSGANTKGNLNYKLSDGAEVEEYLYVVTSDYLADGGDKMDFFKDPLGRIRTGIKIRDAIIDDFRVKGLAGQQLESELDGRIAVVKF
jgi:2',3'-cyclic-nucleotide 2'-phosphodiesterase (5'-nucleotidase family)